MTSATSIRPTAQAGPSARTKGDDGSVLIIALVFISVIGVIIAALLVETQVHFRTSVVAKTLSRQLYAADAGIEYGIQTLRAGSIKCADIEEPNDSLDPITVNGMTVTVDCQVSHGFGTGAKGYAIVTTENSPLSLRTQGGNQPKIVEGPIWAGGIASDANLEIQQGHANEQSGATTCSSNADKPAALVVQPPYTYRCRDVSTSPLAKIPAVLPSAIPVNRASTPVLTMGANCAVFYPGRYAAAPVLSAGQNYFVSGVYYFDNVGEIAVKQQSLVGGQRDVANGEDAIDDAMANPCTTDAAIRAFVGAASFPGTGYGVKFLMGGNSWLHVLTNANVELFRRSGGGAAEGTEGISIQAIPDTSTDVWVGRQSTLRYGTADSPIVWVESGSTPKLSLHGRLHAPLAYVDFFATNESKAQIVGGIVAGRLLLQSSNSATGLKVVSISDGPGSRVVLLRATATGSSAGSKSVVAEALVDVGNGSARSYEILSWRTE